MLLEDTSFLKCKRKCYCLFKLYGYIYTILKKRHHHLKQTHTHTALTQSLGLSFPTLLPWGGIKWSAPVDSHLLQGHDNIKGHVWVFHSELLASGEVHIPIKNGKWTESAWATVEFCYIRFNMCRTVRVIYVIPGLHFRYVLMDLRQKQI